MRVMCLGDVVARPGRAVLKSLLTDLVSEHDVQLVIANGENASGGTGLDPDTAREIYDAGVDLITLGDHTWRRKQLQSYLDSHSDSCIRPANYPEGAPGCGWLVRELPGGVKLGLMNLIGRVFMNAPLDCPFKKADQLLSEHLSDCNIVVCDFHAEATSEKLAMGRYLDGRVDILFGTHTHVQTADEVILPGGTAYISDLGMCGSAAGVIGMDAETALNRFLTGRPSSYKAAVGAAHINGIVVEFDGSSKNASRIFRISESE